MFGGAADICRADVQNGIAHRSVVIGAHFGILDFVARLEYRERKRNEI